MAGPLAAAEAGEAADLMASSATAGEAAVDTTTTKPAAVEEDENDDGGSSTGHPYGVKPWGNFLTDGGGTEVGWVGVGRLMDGMGRWILIGGWNGVGHTHRSCACGPKGWAAGCGRCRTRRWCTRCCRALMGWTWRGGLGGLGWGGVGWGIDRWIDA